ncbi:hypothetical protein [Bdellovibrio bacteriovorus]|uniref:hypothetical protein n=1 Tax=Bdellovibrio bacteriovorus TaxID=959 RepID=UPI0035A7172C
MYQFVNGDIKLIGTFNYISMIPKTTSLISKPTVPTEGTYILTMKNVSNHNRAVRGEVIVNGSVVLKPQDFCKAPPPKTPDKGTDDMDDKNEHRLKRCLQKRDVYAVVNLKKTNEVKFKIYDRGDSLVQFTLNKK